MTPHLFEEAVRAEKEARAVGLDFFEVVFEMLDARDVNAVAAYGGFPIRYPSWRFGMDFERLQKGYDYGLSKIYELVINNDPTYAYLVRSNSLMEQKLVMAHVFGHADFFKHNVWFAPTERKMVEVMGRNAGRIRGHVDRHGQNRVERFLDTALSLDSLIDPYLPLREHLQGGQPSVPTEGLAERARRSFEASMGEPEPALEAQAAENRALPTYDVIGFLMEHAQLEAWQRDILRMVRDEAYYFLPQRMTKIMNEGWASFWHSRLLTSRLLDPSEIVDFADCHAGATAVAPGQLNPYKLGIELFRHAEHKGHDLFRLRRVHNDVSFIDEVVDEEFASTNQLFVYQRNNRTGRPEVADRSWTAIKEQLLRELTWCGAPRIQLVQVGADRELTLVHHHEGRDIKIDEAGELLKQIATLWGSPVHLLTMDDGQGRRVTSDGEEVSVVETKAAEEACGTSAG
ncbi:MAG: SpoVR family protein [bacterium]|nr:SpoVR family protein [bacterium]